MNWEDWNEDEEKRVIPKIPGNRFLMENWNAGFCACFVIDPVDDWQKSLRKVGN
jgi:hypothetical protein|nr:MAG TPA: hypothetical protein [Caudoviricetes sp.]